MDLNTNVPAWVVAYVGRLNLEAEARAALHREEVENLKQQVEELKAAVREASDLIPDDRPDVPVKHGMAYPFEQVEELSEK